jgi:hypothetical protein
MPIPAAELDSLVARLEAAAARLRTEPVQPHPAAPPPPREQSPGGEPDLQAALDGLAHASVEVRRARARVEELGAWLAHR